MIHLKRYDLNHVYMSPASTVMDAQAVTEQFPAVAYFTHVVETDANGEMMFALQNLSAMRNQYGIDASISEDAAIAALQNILNQQANATQEPSAEERIAAAMEFQNVMNF